MGLLAYPSLIFNDPPHKNRNDYRNLSRTEIVRKLGEYGLQVELAETEDEEDEARFALQELRAVLMERR